MLALGAVRNRLSTAQLLLSITALDALALDALQGFPKKWCCLLQARSVSELGVVQLRAFFTL